MEYLHVIFSNPNDIIWSEMENPRLKTNKIILCFLYFPVPQLLVFCLEIMGFDPFEFGLLYCQTRQVPM